MEFYRQHGIAWVARPGHGDLGEVDDDGENKGETKEGDVEKGLMEKKAGKPFHRAGRFKKASNLNYGEAFSFAVNKINGRLMNIQRQVLPSL